MYRIRVKLNATLHSLNAFCCDQLTLMFTMLKATAPKLVYNENFCKVVLFDLIPFLLNFKHALCFFDETFHYQVSTV